MCSLQIIKARKPLIWQAKLHL